jgi:phage head maturation protease
MNKFNRFIPISKADDEKRMVYGYASTPDLDSQGEIVALDALKAALPDYLKFPTIREMHQPSAVGTTKQAVIEDGKGLFIGAKVVDDNAWTKVKEGVYKGFSIGGSIVSKVDNIIQSLNLSEISLVDRPANAAAVITVYKSEQPTTVEMFKATVAEVAEEDDWMRYMELNHAMDVLSAANTLKWMRRSYKDDSKKVSMVDKAINMLKDLAIDILDDTETEKFCSILDIEKAKMSSKQRGSLKDSDFAVPGKRKLPINDASHVRNAMARFNQTQFSSADEKKKAKSKIIAAARRFGIKVDEFKQASYSIEFAKLKAVDFALPKSREYPLATPDFVKASMIKYLSTNFSDEATRVTVRDRLIKAASEFDLNVDGFLEVDAMPMYQRKQLSALSQSRYSKVDGSLLERVQKVIQEANAMSKAKKTDKKSDELKAKAKDEKNEQVEDEEVEDQKTDAKETKSDEKPGDKKEESKADEQPKEEAQADESKPGTQVVDEAKQTADMPDYMQKLEKVEQDATKEADTDEAEDGGEGEGDAEETQKSENAIGLQKIESLEASMSKVATVLESLVKRIQTLEAQPAQPKTKTTLVNKDFSRADDEKSGLDEASQSRLDKVNKRLGELKTLRESNPGEYISKYQSEALGLLDEKSALLKGAK